MKITPLVILRALLITPWRPDDGRRWLLEGLGKRPRRVRPHLTDESTPNLGRERLQVRADRSALRWNDPALAIDWPISADSPSAGYLTPVNPPLASHGKKPRAARARPA